MLPIAFLSRCLSCSSRALPGPAGTIELGAGAIAGPLLAVRASADMDLGSTDTPAALVLSEPVDVLLVTPAVAELVVVVVVVVVVVGAAL